MAEPIRSRRPRASRLGFTLIELMIVIAIIAIVAAIALPNLIAARLRANESASIGVLRNLATAQTQFRHAGRADEDGDSNGEYGYFGELTGGVAVRGTVPEYFASQLTSSMALVDANGEVQRNGYFYRLYLPAAGGVGTRETAGGGQAPGVLSPDLSENVWVVYAVPAKYEGTGIRTFFMNQKGDLLWTDCPIYEKGDCAPLQAGAALLTADASLCNALPAVGTAGADGNEWRQVQ